MRAAEYVVFIVVVMTLSSNTKDRSGHVLINLLLLTKNPLVLTISWNVLVNLQWSKTNLPILGSSHVRSHPLSGYQCHFATTTNTLVKYLGNGNVCATLKSVQLCHIYYLYRLVRWILQGNFNSSI